VGVSYYQASTSFSDNSTLPIKYLLKISSDGGESFDSTEIPITEDFDILTAPFSRGYFLGDYQALMTIGDAFSPFFVKANMDKANMTDVFTTSIKCPIND
jgi:hypothetical protein